MAIKLKKAKGGHGSVSFSFSLSHILFAQVKFKGRERDSLGTRPWGNSLCKWIIESHGDLQVRIQNCYAIKVQKSLKVHQTPFPSQPGNETKYYSPYAYIVSSPDPTLSREKESSDRWQLSIFLIVLTQHYCFLASQSDCRYSCLYPSNIGYTCAHTP